MLNQLTICKNVLKMRNIAAMGLSAMVIFLVGSINVTVQGQAQEPYRYVDVAPDDFPASVGALNEAIDNDTERDEHTIYRLERGGVYWTEVNIQPEGGILHIEAEEGDGPLPVIRPASDLEGVADRIFRPRSDLYLKDAYIQGLSDFGEIVKNNIRMTAEDIRTDVVNIYYDWEDQAFFRMDNSGQTVTIRDSKFRNTARARNEWVGRWVDTRGNLQDSVIVENSTMYMAPHTALRGGGGRVHYMKWNHNTIVNVGWLFEFSIVDELEFTNNLLIDVGYKSFRWAPVDDETGEVYTDSIANGIFMIESAEDIEGITDADRSLNISNNNVGYYSQEYLDVYEQHPDSLATPLEPLSPLSFTDTLRQDGILVYENNFEEGVDFTDPPTKSVNFVDFILRSMVEDTEDEDFPTDAWDRYDDGAGNEADDYATDETTAYWRDFSYPKSAVSYTAAEGEYPVGDLNWFPDKKAEWEAEDTSIDEELLSNNPEKFEILGNYPNPFNPATSITYQLTNPADVTMEVFNVVGQKVDVRDLGSKSAGTHTVTYDAGNMTSGIYIVRMRAGKEVATTRMTLVK